jgi:hypothetical protein
MNSVGARGQGQVGSVVEDERNPGRSTHLAGQAGPVDDLTGVEVLLAQLDDVDAPGDARGNEVGQVRSVSRAQVQPPCAEPG